jgi:O-antigen/teichoic acid export membrane protein
MFSPSEYGVIGLIATLTGLVGMFAVLGLDNSSARWFYDTDEIQDRKSTISSWFWCQLSACTIISFSLFLFAPSVAGSLLGSEQYAILVILAAITLPLGTFNRVLGNWFRYQRRAWTTTIFSTASSFSTIGIIVLFVVIYQWGLVGIYLARLIAATLIAIAAVCILWTWIKPANFSWARLRDMLTFGLPLVPAAIASWITISSDRFILILFHDASEVGFYTVAVALASGVGVATGAFQRAWGPFAYSIYREEDSVNVYAEVMSLYALLGCLLGTTVSLFAPLLVRVLATPEYSQSTFCISFLVFSYIGKGAIYIVAIGSSIVKRSKPIAVSIFITACINLLLNFVLIPSFGKEGAAIATMVSYLGGLIYLYPVSQNYYRIPYQFWKAIVCFGFSWFLILMDHFFIPTWGLTAFGIRLGMCSLFIPFAFSLGIIKPSHAKRLLLHFRTGPI